MTVPIAPILLPSPHCEIHTPIGTSFFMISTRYGCSSISLGVGLSVDETVNLKKKKGHDLIK